jgi:hypothetical protein
MTLKYDATLYNQGKSAVASLLNHYRYGAYRAIKDPDGIVSLWAIEGKPNAPFSISFVDKGRVYRRIEDVPQDFLKSFLEYVRKAER